MRLAQWAGTTDGSAHRARHDFFWRRRHRRIESFTFKSPWFHFHWINRVAMRGWTTMYLHALNAPGTVDHDMLLGRSLTIRSYSSVSASMVDSTISTHGHPRVRVAVAPGRAGGTVDIERGSTLLKRITLAPGTRTTVSLPPQRKGLWTLSVRYSGSTAYAPSSKAVRVRVS